MEEHLSGRCDAAFDRYHGRHAYVTAVGRFRKLVCWVNMRPQVIDINLFSAYDSVHDGGNFEEVRKFACASRRILREAWTEPCTEPRRANLGSR